MSGESVMRLPIILLLVCLALPAGCSYKPVRHLASDAALIKPGASTRAEVLRYLGAPDSRRAVAPGIEEYVYTEERKSQLANLPWLGRLVDTDSRETVVVTLKGEQVAACDFRLAKEADHDWKEDVKLEDVR